jgi:DNA repair exonuclease SbcCD ATPase subunit
MLNSPLIEVDAQRKINEIQEKYLELKKGLNQLNEISSLPENKLISELDGYKRLKYTLKNNFYFLDQVIDEFNNNLEDDNQTYYSTKTRKDIKEVLSKIDMNKLKSQNEEYKKIVDKIDKRMHKYIDIEEQKRIEKENEKDQGLVMKEISNNEEMLQKRTEELLEIKNISAQVAEMSTSMGIVINEQGKKLDTIESNVERTEENTKKAYKEALETEIIVNKSKKKLYCLAFLILLLIFVIIYIVYKVFS